MRQVQQLVIYCIVLQTILLQENDSAETSAGTITSQQCQIFGVCFLKQNQSSNATNFTVTQNKSMTADQCIAEIQAFSGITKAMAGMKIFSVYNTRVTFVEAKRNCAENGSQLAKIENKMENDILHCARNGIGSSTWIGLQRIQGSNKRRAFSWLDGSNVTYVNWKTGEPNNLTQPCVFLDSASTWSDIFCNRTFVYVCYTNGSSNCPVESCQTLITKTFEYQSNCSTTLNMSFADTSVLGFSAKTNETFIITIAILAPQSNNFSQFIERDPVQTSQTTKAQTKVLLQSLISFKLSTNLKELTVNYSIRMSSNTVNVTEITSSATYGKKGVVRFTQAQPQCVYLDETRKKFSTYGILTIRKADGQFICSSNHTTIFSALLSLTVLVIPDQAKVLTYITESISVISLLLTIAILVRLKKKLRNERVVVQINLSTAMVCFHLSALLHDVAIVNSRACEFIAITLHYFMLASAFWMLVDGVTLVTKTFDSALSYGSSKQSKNLRFLVGWAIPAVIVAISATAGFFTKSYMSKTPDSIAHLPEINKYQQCWLDKQNKGVLIGGLLVPLLVVLSVNVLILVKVAVFVFRMSKQTDNFKPVESNPQRRGTSVGEDMEHIKASVRATCLLLPVLGIPWFLLLLSGENTIFVYVNIILNGLQGFFIFLIYCPMSKDVRHTFVRMWNRSKLGERFPLTSTSESSHTINFSATAST